MAIGRREMLAAGAAFALAAAAPAPAPARRVVSLNPCLDAALLAVADPAQVAALSHFSREEDASSVGAAALKFPFVYESAEEVIARSPDLVLASRHSSLATRNALRRLGVPVLLFSTPDTVAGSLDQMMRIASAVGRTARGRAERARIEAALAAAAPPPGTKPLTALVYQRGGFSSGPGTLMDELLTRTGFTNAIVRYGITRTRDVPLEQVVADPPQVLLRGVDYPGQPGWGERIMRHPALARVGPRMRIVTFPQRLMFCGGPNLIEAANLLAGVRRRALAAA
jgi:iron complex transport system substrate-binding protein